MSASKKGRRDELAGEAGLVALHVVETLREAGYPEKILEPLYTILIEALVRESEIEEAVVADLLDDVRELEALDDNEEEFEAAEAAEQVHYIH